MSLEQNSGNYHVSLTIRNDNSTEMRLQLEPWGDYLSLPPGAEYEVIFTGPVGHTIGIETVADHLTLYSWPGATAAVWSQGKQLW